MFNEHRAVTSLDWDLLRHNIIIYLVSRSAPSTILCRKSNNNAIIHIGPPPFYLDESIFALGASEIFLFSIFALINISKQYVPDENRRSVASVLGIYCLTMSYI